MGYPEINHITLAGSNNRVRIKKNFPEALGLIHCPRWNRTLIYISWDLLLMKKAVNVSLLKVWKRTEATNYIDSILQEFQLFILGCRLTGKDRSLIRIRSRIIPGWPNKGSLRYTGRLLEICVGILYWDIRITVITSVSETEDMGSIPIVPTNIILGHAV